jgi:hypothetical protein
MELDEIIIWLLFYGKNYMITFEFLYKKTRDVWILEKQEIFRLTYEFNHKFNEDQIPQNLLILTIIFNLK